MQDKKNDSSNKNNADNYSTQIEKEKPKFIPQEFLIATNSENLKNIITSGLIRPKEAYKKYYQDLCKFSPGLIPVFIDHIPSNSLAQCKEEEDISVVIISLDLSWDDLYPLIRTCVDGKGELIHGQIDNDMPVSLIYFDGIIPASAVKTVYFKSKEEKAQFLAIDYKNFKPGIINLKVDSQLFNKGDLYSIQISFNNSEYIIPAATEDYLESDARGGVITLLMHSLPPLPESESFIKSVIDKALSDNVRLQFQVLPGQLEIINNWIDNKFTKTCDVDMLLFWHLLNLLSGSDPQKGITTSQFLNDLKQKFEHSEELWQHPATPYQKVKAKISTRFDEISDAVLQNTDPDGFFQDDEIKSSVMRGLLLFLIYTKDILSFRKNKKLIKEWGIEPSDFLYADILYAAWQGWKQINEDLRPKDNDTIGLVCTFMSNWHNKKYSSSPYIFPSTSSLKMPGNCSPWEKEMLLKADWNKKRNLRKCAVNIAKSRDWKCLLSKINTKSENLADIKYSKNGNAALTLIGDITIKETIDAEDFRNSLTQVNLTEEEINNFKKTFG